MPAEDLQLVGDALLPWARMELVETGELVPTGAIITDLGNVVKLRRVRAIDPSAGPVIEELTAEVIAGLRAAVTQHGARAVGWCVAHQVRGADGAIRDAIVLQYEERGVAQLIVQTYRDVPGEAAVFDPPKAQRATAQIFTPPTPTAS